MPSKRSGFITGIAWTFIALAGFMTLIAILQNAMLTMMFSAEDMRYLLREADKSMDMPPMLRFILENFRAIFVSLLVFSALTLAASIGLLQRRNWARLAFIALMAIGVVANLAAVGLPFLMSGSSSLAPAALSTDIAAQFGLLFKALMVISVITALVSAWICWWLMKRLMADDIKSEFGAN